MAKPQPCIVLYEDDQSTFENLSDPEIGRLIRTLFEYCATGTVKQSGGREAILVPTFIARIDRDSEARAKKSQTLRKNAKVRWKTQNDANACNCMQMHQKEKEQEKEKVTQKEREEEKEIFSLPTCAREDEAWRYAIFTYSASKIMDREAFDNLADQLSRDDLAHYLDVVEECGAQGRPFTDPVAAILSMARKDGKI